jgi:two-component system cell cycle response regulator
VANKQGDTPPFDDTNTRTLKPLAPQEQKRDRPYLIVLAGAAMGVMHRIDKETTIVGRGDKVDLRIIDDGISREHSRVVQRGDKLHIEDLNSTNGTFCNGVRVRSQALSEGDKILIGSSTILKFTFHDQLDEVFQRQMTESALRDALTKVFNKRYLLDHLKHEFSYSQRHKTPLALIFMDIDRFKVINDTHGHPAGDAVLSELATLLTRSLRTEDILARYGGEEFAVVCRGLDGTRAANLAERLRVAVEQHRFEFGGRQIPATISLGVARVPDRRIASSSDLLVAADEAMYEAKRSGRNRVCVRAPSDDDEITDSRPPPDGK